MQSVVQLKALARTSFMGGELSPASLFTQVVGTAVAKIFLLKTCSDSLCYCLCQSKQKIKDIEYPSLQAHQTLSFQAHMFKDTIQFGIIIYWLSLQAPGYVDRRICFKSLIHLLVVQFQEVKDSASLFTDVVIKNCRWFL